MTRSSPVRAFIGIGSNLGDRMALIRGAVAGLPDVVRVSPVYETEPVGGPPGQGPYLNVVVELRTTKAPRELLEIAGRLETAAGREREVKDGPRTLDVDILLVGDTSVDEPDLQVPHPRMWERRFVLAPLADLAPDLVVADRLGPAGGPPGGPAGGPAGGPTGGPAGGPTGAAAGGVVRRLIDSV